MRSRSESLAKASKTLMLKEPFWGLFLIGLNKVWHSTFPTAGVSKNGINYQLTIGEGFWDRLLDPWKTGILKHELLHICFFHIEMGMSGKYPEKEVYAIAIDICVNQYIEDLYLPAKDVTKEQFDAKWNPIVEGLKVKFLSKQITREDYMNACKDIPPRGVYIEDFKDLNLELKRGADYYYDKLLKEAKSKKQSPGHSNLRDLIKDLKDGVPGPCDHDWSEFEGLDDATKRLLKSQLDYQLKAVAEQVEKSRGTVPGEMSDYIKALQNPEPPKFDWRGYLRRFAGGSTRVYTKKLRRKFNKRFEDNPGLKIKPKKHILVAVDTSGSVSNDELVEFFKEIDHIHRTGAEVTVAQTDAAISDISLYRRDQDIKIVGRGGTDFSPLCQYYNEQRRKYTCCIFLTDGEAPAPEKPLGRILWVLSTKSKDHKHLPGHTIKLN